MKTIGVDVGGTFTDIVLLRHGHWRRSPFTRSRRRRTIRRAASCRASPNSAATTASTPADIDYVFHGTTTATNAVLEHKGARAGMITNEGFRDIIHIARHQRVEHYSIMQELPWQNRPLVKRRHRKTVAGRLDPAARRGARAARRSRRAPRRAS